MELNKIKEIEKMVGRKSLVYRTNEYTYILISFRTLNTFDRDIYNGTITLKGANKDQKSLLVEIMNFKSKIKYKSLLKNQKKSFRTYMHLYSSCTSKSK